MSALAKWKVHGPVKTLKSEFATWDQDRQDWHPYSHMNVASFDPAGRILSTDVHNPDGTIAHSRWFYDDTGRMLESNSWMNDEPINRIVYLYEETGRLIRATRLDGNGTRKDVEVYSYDVDGRKTKVQFLYHREADSECTAGNACGASSGYAIEGTDIAFGAPGATTLTITYDDKSLPAKVSFHDAHHQLLTYAILTRDRAGRLLSVEKHQGEKSPFQGYLDKAPPEQRERLAAALKEVLGETLSSTRYEYDAKGRLVTREHRMGKLGEDYTTYRYRDHDDPVEETIEHRSHEAKTDETGNVQYSSNRVNVQHNQLEYIYDECENWTERVVSHRLESQSGFQRSNVERRTITYYSM